MISKIMSIKTIGYLLIPTLYFFTSSCINYKHLNYLDDSKKDERFRGYPKSLPVYHLKAKDNLYVSLISSDLDINKLYNPANSGATQPTNREYETPADQYVYGYEVDSLGFLNLPLIGKMNVAGKTLQQCERIIEDTARHYLKEVTAKVKLLNNRVTVIGEVKNPGVYYKYGYDFTVFEAIGMAQGTTNYAQLDSVLVLRPIPGGSQTYVLNLKTRSALLSDGYFLQPNDVVIIEPSKYKNLELHLPIYTVTLTAASTFLLLLNVIKK